MQYTILSPTPEKKGKYLYYYTLISTMDKAYKDNIVTSSFFKLTFDSGKICWPWDFSQQAKT